MAKYQKNTILHTRDGRHIGNAIIQEVIESEYRIITDYGSQLSLLESQIDELFRPAVWYDENQKKIAQEGHKHYNPK